jgi:hypothetical protein
LPTGQAGKRSRVLRGGSYNNNASNARCAARNRNNPNNQWNNNGFRVCLVGASHVTRFGKYQGFFSLLLRPEMLHVHGRAAAAEM